MGNSPLVFLGCQSYRRDGERQQGLPVGRRSLLPLTLHPTGQDMIRSGDHVYVDRGFCTRHGIDMNMRQVIHSSPFLNNRSFRIRDTNPWAFADSSQIYVKNYGPRLNYRQMVTYTKSLPGESDCDLIDHDGGCFAWWCVTGKSVSGQGGRAWRLAWPCELALSPVVAPGALPSLAGAAARVIPGLVDATTTQGTHFVPPVPSAGPSRLAQQRHRHKQPV